MSADVKTDVYGPSLPTGPVDAAIDYPAYCIKVDVGLIRQACRERLLGSGYTIDAHAVGMLDDVLASARQIRQAVRGPMLGERRGVDGG